MMYISRTGIAVLLQGLFGWCRSDTLTGHVAEEDGHLGLVIGI